MSISTRTSPGFSFFTLKLMSSFVLVLAAGCSSAGNRNMTAKSSFSNKPFQTSYVDPESIIKISSIKLDTPVWDAQAIECKDKLDVSKELNLAFSGAVNTKVLPSGKATTDSSTSVLKLRMINCQERIGSAYGVTQPAQVGFLVNVYDANGKEVWAGAYSLKDTAILENLLAAKEKLKIGAGWLSANDLLKHGLELAATEFENQRSRIFLGTN